MRPLRGERGSASMWVIAAAALVLVVGLFGSVRCAALLVRHRAERAADLVALAAAGRIGIDTSGCQQAASIALANGARLRVCRIVLDTSGRSGVADVWVSIAANLPIVGPRVATASARAARDPPAGTGG